MPEHVSRELSSMAYNIKQSTYKLVLKFTGSHKTPILYE